MGVSLGEHGLHVKVTRPDAGSADTWSVLAVPCWLSLTSAWMVVVTRSAPCGPPFIVTLATSFDAGTTSLTVAVSMTTRLPSTATTTAIPLNRYAGKSGCLDSMIG